MVSCCNVKYINLFVFLWLPCAKHFKGYNYNLKNVASFDALTIKGEKMMALQAIISTEQINHTL